MNHLIFNNKSFFYFQTGVFITSSLCGVAVGGCYIVLLFVLSFCEHSCEPQTTVATIVFILSFLPCIAGCSGCYCVSFSSSQVTTNIKTSLCNFIPREFVIFFYSLDNTVYVCSLVLKSS